jgi:hypothetical protein
VRLSLLQAEKEHTRRGGELALTRRQLSNPARRDETYERRI